MVTSAFRDMFWAGAIASSILVGACEEDTAQPKFVALAQEDNLHAGGKYLIKRVHEQQWLIVYSFKDNNGCDNQFDANDQARSQLLNKVRESIAVWLSPLSDKQGIIKPQDIVLQEKASPKLDEDHHMSIIFNCDDEKRSSAKVWGEDIIPEINIFYSPKDNDGLEMPDKLAATALKKYNATTIHHEIGHAFGLGDTYVDIEESEDWLQRYNKSKGGFIYTVGIQPLSVMNFNNYASLDHLYDHLTLGLDDIAGIRWLYRFYHDKDIGPCDCSYDYVYEKETGGCRPKHPLIFAAQHSDPVYVKSLLSEKIEKLREQNIHMVNKQDEFGNTALHFAAAKRRHDDRVYKELKKLTFNGKLLTDTSIRNKMMKTAQDIYEADDPLSLLYHKDDIAAAKRSHQQEVAKVCSPVKLRLAVEAGQVEQVKELLPLVGEEVNQKDRLGVTALHLAVNNLRFYYNLGDEPPSTAAHESIIAALLAHKDIDLLVKAWDDPLGRTPDDLFKNGNIDTALQAFGITPLGFIIREPNKPKHCPQEEFSNLDYLNCLAGLPSVSDEYIPPYIPPSPPAVFNQSAWCRVVKLFHDTHTRRECSRP